jgi:uncharacterized protein YbjQ (UPF0145 family)
MSDEQDQFSPHAEPGEEPALAEHAEAGDATIHAPGEGGDFSDHTVMHTVADEGATEVAEGTEPFAGMEDGSAGSAFPAEGGASAIYDADGLASTVNPEDVVDPATLGENSDPEIAVDELLSAAVLDDPESALGQAFTEAGLAEAASTRPSFQLHLHLTKRDQTNHAKSLAKELGIRVTDTVWGSAQPILSQLTEYQAIAMARGLRARGILMTVNVQWPQFPHPTEEDLALGGLSTIPDPSPTEQEGAPSVALPGSESEVLLCAFENVTGFQVKETRGIVTAHRSIARRLFREEEMAEKLQRELEQLPGRNVPHHLPPSRIGALFRDLFLDLQKNALRLGANAVLGLRVEYFAETTRVDPDLDDLRLVAFGTAAVVEKH